jgi:hypothetical protein
MDKNDMSIAKQADPRTNIMDETEEATSAFNDSASSTEDLKEAIDKFDSDRGPTMIIESYSTPFVLEVAPRNGGFSHDPLFRANTLYEGEMSSKQVDAYCSKTVLGNNHKRRSSWADSVVRLLMGSTHE